MGQYKMDKQNQIMEGIILGLILLAFISFGTVMIMQQQNQEINTVQHDIEEKKCYRISWGLLLDKHIQTSCDGQYDYYKYGYWDQKRYDSNNETKEDIRNY